MNTKIKQDELIGLWQQQDVAQIDIDQIKQQWRVQKAKQWLYLILDLIPSIALPVLVYQLRDRLTLFELIWFSSFIVIGTFFFFYVAWLRRYSLSFRSQSHTLSDYTDLLKKQCRQNIKIAYITQISTPFLVLAFVIYFIGMYLGEALDAERLWRKLMTAGLILGVSCPALWFWAKARRQKFEQKLAVLEQY